VAHTPQLAAGTEVEAGGEPSRSLILAGGGMRVAWQAGVLCALEEAGLSFAHADGTSGGTINLAMLLSGRSPRDMCERWRTLPVRNFAAPLPLRQYLRAPRLPGLGGASGVVEKVFPHLGINVDAIRDAEGIDGTFNVCNHSDKINESIGHREVDLGALVAGISLPVFMPAVRRGGAVYTDSVWIKDANLIGAVKRGAEELWILWCIGNTAEYRDGAFAQYVHMIEQSANGVLFEEFDRIAALNDEIRRGTSPYGQRRPVTAHVIKPRYPLPLDPDFFLGRIDAATLIAMGYRDASRYLMSMDFDHGVPLTPRATRMEPAGTRVSWSERAAGELDDDGGFLKLDLAVEVPDASRFEAGQRHEAQLVGRVRGPAVGDVLLREGSVVLQGGELIYDASFASGGRRLRLRGRRAAIAGGDWVERLRSLDQLHVQLYEEGGGDSALLGEGMFDSERGRLRVPTLSFSVTNTPSTRRRLAAAWRFCRFLLVKLLRS
jgi:hypothetical protein